MANKKTPGVAKKKVNWKIYLRNTWQLYAVSYTHLTLPTKLEV